MVAGDRILTRFYVNGSASLGWSDDDAAGDRCTTKHHKIINMTAGQYVDMRGYYSTGGNCDTEGGYTHIFCEEIR